MVHRILAGPPAKERSKRSTSDRRGSIAVFAATLMVLMFAVLAFSIDMGLAYVNRTELQRAADAAAIAAANQLLEQQLFDPTVTQSSTEARQTAVQFAAFNNIGSIYPALANDDVTIGLLVDLTNPNAAIEPAAYFYNAARVRVQRTQGINGQTPFLFARVLGFDAMSQMAEGTAAYVSAFKGFTSPSNGQHLGILPVALDVDTWEDLQQGLTQDNWTWDAANGGIFAGADGIPECNLYPQGGGLAGNRGTLEIGYSGTSINDIKRQITNGVSPDDLNYHGGKLEFDAKGEIELAGDTGISEDFDGELAQIKGEPRIIPVFDYAVDNGSNANFTIVKFVGVRVMEVQLAGSIDGKRLIVQPAPVKTLGGIPGDDVTKVMFIYSPVKLIR